MLIFAIHSTISMTGTYPLADIQRQVGDAPLQFLAEQP